MGLMKEFETKNMKVKIYDSRKTMGINAAQEAAAKIRELLESKDELNIIFAAAPSQNEFLASLTSCGDIDWSKINAFHMDEYIGLASDAPQAFGNFLRDRIFRKVGFKSVNYLNGNASDIEGECERYSSLLKQYPADLVFMGIGENGHIAFNDPHVANFGDKKLVKKVDLDEKCRKQQVNDGCFESLDKVPAYALTLTIPALMSGKSIFCMVPAKTKADAAYNAVYGEISESSPASILKNHNSAVLYLDTDSASKIL
jgi:glucosamine-6-phosphate deaminase